MHRILERNFYYDIADWNMFQIPGAARKSPKTHTHTQKKNPKIRNVSGIWVNKLITSSGTAQLHRNTAAVAVYWSQAMCWKWNTDEKECGVDGEEKDKYQRT